MILLIGGSGTLGKELQKLIKCDAPLHQEVDILDEEDILLLPKYELIVHSAAETDLLVCEQKKQHAYDVNVIGTRNVASLGIPILYISTSYVFDGQKGNYDETDYPNPQNFYSLTKLLGEYECRRSPKSVVIRCLFKPRPFKHAHGCIDQFTSGLYADQIAGEIALAIEKFDELPPTLHIGGPRKSTFELAKESKPDITPIKLKDIKNVQLPKDTSLNSSVWKSLKEKWRKDEN